MRVCPPTEVGPKCLYAIGALLLDVHQPDLARDARVGFANVALTDLIRMQQLGAKGWPREMEIDKSKIVQVLRRRGQHDRAEWVDRELPDRVDTIKNAGILATLSLNPADITDPMP